MRDSVFRLRDSVFRMKDSDAFILKQNHRFHQFMFNQILV